MYSYNTENYFWDHNAGSNPGFSLGDAISVAIEKRQDETAVRYRTLVEHSKDIVFFSDGFGKILEISSKAHQLLGYYSEELLTLRISDIVEESDRKHLSILTDHLCGSDNSTLKINLIHKLGNPIPVEINFKRFSYNRLQGTIQPSSVAGIPSDFLKRTQKMNTIGEIVGGISHDFNNVLTIILACAQLMKLNVEKDSESGKHLQRIIEASDRGSSIAKQLLSFSRPNRNVLNPVLISGIIKELSQSVPYLMGKGIKVEYIDLAPNSRVYGDSCQIYQAILNLLLNAKDAMNCNGRIKITQSVISQETILERFKSPNSKYYLQLEIWDSGEGMDEFTKEKIFHPFFTTKENGKGTGLGLAVVKTIIDEHCGFIDFQSTPGKGTSFFLFFPLFEESASVEFDPRII
ncbi:two-component system sensor histidine kinase NtrB [Leptospira stimsonii]|uniref:histidine kinase n=1 Tax=Leptospira stimsonii TaxID=2202203 RepID=A0A396ZDE0_9LEPT|nr:ATP-binding protein [Leptospira stimsonii]RHX91894.1 hypothetical protein DLM75_01225 [Leptospira stimsonii]